MFLFPEPARRACEEYFACVQQFPSFWGRGEFALQGCLESLESRACPDLNERPSDRFSYYGSQFPWGPECGAPATATPAPPPGAPRAGEVCLQGFGEISACELGVYCELDGGPPVIGTYYCGVCEPPVEVGASCNDEQRCADGALCVMGTCREIRNVGEPCEVSEECRFHVCDASSCRSPYLPTPYAEIVGGGCVEHSDCGNQAGLFCDAGTCRPLPNEGDPCSPGLPHCRLGHQCIGDRCVALGCSIDLGEPCDVGCQAGDCIDGVCVRSGGLGAPCRFTCGGELICDDDACKDLDALFDTAPNGTPCDFDSDCTSHFCERDLSAYCDGNRSCSIPRCDQCGLCADVPTVARCE